MYVADMHCDTISKIYNAKERGEQVSLLSNSLHVDIKKLQKGNYLLQNFAVFVDLKTEKSPYECAKKQIAVFREELQKNKEWIRQVRTYEEIKRAQKEGKISALLTLEEGEICEGDLNKLEEFYEAGVRMMTLTWNYPNSLGTEEGLTKTGIRFLHRMKELGILPDVSHLSEKGFYDVYCHGKGPFVASHSNAMELCHHKRNLTDDMIRKIAERGGVIGINYYGNFLEENAKDGVYYSRVSRNAEHILYMIRVGGHACVALGSDFDGINCPLELEDCSVMERLESELHKRGLTPSEIEGIFCRNILNLYKEIF